MASPKMIARPFFGLVLHLFCPLHLVARYTWVTRTFLVRDEFDTSPAPSRSQPLRSGRRKWQVVWAKK